MMTKAVSDPAVRCLRRRRRFSIPTRRPSCGSPLMARWPEILLESNGTGLLPSSGSWCFSASSGLRSQFRIFTRSRRRLEKTNRCRRTRRGAPRLRFAHHAQHRAQRRGFPRDSSRSPPTRTSRTPVAARASATYRRSARRFRVPGRTRERSDRRAPARSPPAVSCFQLAPRSGPTPAVFIGRFALDSADLAALAARPTDADGAEYLVGIKSHYRQEPVTRFRTVICAGLVDPCLNFR